MRVGDSKLDVVGSQGSREEGGLRLGDDQLWPRVEGDLYRALSLWPLIPAGL